MAYSADLRWPHLAEIDDLGDINAEAGSKEWALAVRSELQAFLHDTEASAESLGGWMKLMEQHQGYRHLYDEQGQPYGSFELFCLAPKPFGLGYERRAIDRIIAERKDARGRASTAKPLEHPGRPGKGSITIFSGDRGANYLTRRIARDRPDILERMQAGEFRSVRAAALEAGITRPTASVYTDDADSAVRLLLKHFTREQLLAALDA